MSKVKIETLLRAGTHFGHLTSRWNPKMKKFIFMERNGIHIIDLTQVQDLLERAANAAGAVARRGKKILFVGTKKQAREVVRQEAERCGMPYVTERWLGGMLTNYQTIRKSIHRMEQLSRQLEDGTLDSLKKKERLMRTREFEKLERTLSGISDMPHLPGAIFVVDIRREHIAIKEAQRLGIPIITMVDTNCDPDKVNFAIPSNDDALKSIKLITSVIADAIAESSKSASIEKEASSAEAEKIAADKAETTSE